jgi:superfamily II DNA or RNA helicase
MSIKVRITIRNLNYEVIPFCSTVLPSIEYMYTKLSTYTWVYDHTLKRNTRVVDKVFASGIEHNGGHRFNINTLRSFILVLGQRGIVKENIELSFDKDYDIADIEMLINHEFVARDYQDTYVNILTNNDANKYKLVDLEMGKGKSFIAMLALSKLNSRAILLLLPKYIDKWISDIQKLTDTLLDEIFVVQGSKGLNQLLQEVDEVGIENLNYKFIIMSSTTMQNYIRAYENITHIDELDYLVPPQEFTRALGVGVVLNDETHQHFASIFKSMLYLDAKLFIGLSATLETNDPYITSMYKIMFPDEARISNIVKHVSYIDVYAIRYEISTIKYLQFKRQQGYNHNLFESSLMRNSVLLRDYIDMIMFYVKIGYAERALDGEKCLIFCASVNFCTMLTNYIAKEYPNKDVRRYVADDPYENVIEADICVSTVISSGTAIDIPDLTTVIQTISISSIQANKQSFGRLRDIGKDVRFYYMYCRNISKQVKMNTDRMAILKPLAKNYNLMEYTKILRGK